MAFGEGSIRSRAASLIRFSNPSASHTSGQGANQENASNTPIESALNEKTIIEEGNNGLDESQTLSSSGKTHHSSGSNAVRSDRAAQRIVRTIPSMFLNWLSLLTSND